ncbi:MAG: sugar phosphate isomerase/epimerase [Oscillospiraceae bacterium]|jgi:fatty-acyl-CoA synthase|nr:sugar phosphate isomerase/epimerase [Oscillospiraceae bacterium]
MGNALRVSFSTLGCPRWSWQDICATARDLGYDGVEVRGVGSDLSAPSIPQFSQDQIPATLKGLERMRLTIPCLASECCLHLRETAERTARAVDAYIELASALGVPYIRVMGASAVPQPMGGVDAGFVREQAQKFGEIAQKRGVTLLIETHGVWANSEKLAKLLDDIDSDAVQALWDIHHPYRFYGERPRVTYENLGKRIRHTHLKDSVAEGDRFRYAMPGFGDVPFEEAVGLLADQGYEGFYSLEWVKRWDLTLEEPGIVFAHTINLMRSLQER